MGGRGGKSTAGGGKAPIGKEWTPRGRNMVVDAKGMATVIANPQWDQGRNYVPVREREAASRYNKAESAYVYSSDGSLAFKKAGTTGAVHFDQNELRNMSGKVMTHNHPTGGPLSPPDVSIMGRGLTEIRATSSTGTYVLGRLPGKAQDAGGMARDYDKVVQASFSRLSKVADTAYDSYKVGKSDYAAYAKAAQNVNSTLHSEMHQWLSTNATSYGFKYNVEPLVPAP